jgi:hypothetical protein
MEEIKFKTWFPDEKHMTESWTILDIACGYDCGYLVFKEDTGKLIGDVAFRGKVQPIIRQCTGRKDKNGVEIYEGDIIHRQESNYPVVFCDKHSAWCIKVMLHGRALLSTLKYDEIEVVGNIYQNPELLEVAL